MQDYGSPALRRLLETLPDAIVATAARSAATLQRVVFLAQRQDLSVKLAGHLLVAGAPGPIGPGPQEIELLHQLGRLLPGPEFP